MRVQQNLHVISLYTNYLQIKNFNHIQRVTHSFTSSSVEAC